MVETIYALVLVFSSWDDCYNWYDDHKIDLSVEQAEMICAPFLRERELAPLKSPRPQARPTKEND